MTEHRLIKMINKLEGIKKSINKTGGIVHHRGRPRKIHAGILEGGVVTGFDGAGRKRRVGRPRKHHIGGETGGRVTGGEDGGRRRIRRIRRVHIGGEEGGRKKELEE